ncbi:heterokaryon incompatibility protein-domain-containing protein [Immersiella caudata]|uniref:Heterokaryon incompatibility protein-domain-containing protein n=1 Tax=Immersiella caudata TaxID=314043 RepID=A0AA39WLP7_9PEZI|nr:heterokaryon incompatibility protein-domain-containing protein [Immersiella caudata]
MSGQQRSDTPSNAPLPFVSLPDGNIRLLHLRPDRDRDGPLKCQLVDYPLQNMGKRACLYEALSYCWYQSEKPNLVSEKPKWISIDGRRLPITKNLHDALLRLRDDFFGRVMWVDAVCINQGDVEERGHQVRSMTEIYSKANRVIVWLGEAEARDHEAFQAIREVGGKLSSLASNKEADDHEASRAEVGETPCPLPRDKEEAVLQEVAAAQNLRIMCGAVEMDGYAFSLCVEALPAVRNQASPVTYLMRPSIFRPRYKMDHAGRVSLGICPLGGLLDMYHAHEATDPRDKVFAMLGMSSDNHAAVEIAGLLLNYEILWQDLLKRLVYFVLGQQEVRTQPNQETAIIEGKGHVLGVVHSTDQNRVRVTPRISQLPSEWDAQPSVRPIHVGDLVCQLQGATRPMIIRPHKDHFSVIATTVAALDAIPRHRSAQTLESL